MSTPLLHIHDLLITHSGRELLSLSELRVMPGEVLGMIGESGSGKSLSQLAIMGLLPEGLAAKGQIQFNSAQGELDLLAISEDKLRLIRNKEIGMVFQEPMTALNPRMTCGEQLGEAVLVHQKADKQTLRQIVSEALMEVELEDIVRFSESYPHQLSGGQRQRVMIAMATIHRPSLVLADEPTTALDPETGEAVLRLLIERCQKTGSALVLVTHELGIVETWCQSVALLRHGKCLAQGAKNTVFGSTRHAYLQELLDARPAGKRVPLTQREDLLLINSLNKTYSRGRKPLAVLKGVTFALKRGETLAVVGTSGSGKSTVAKVLTGLERADNGEFIFRGEHLEHKKVTGVQMVFQDPYASLNQQISNRETIAEVLKLKGHSHSEANQKAKELLNMVGLNEPLHSRYPHHLSGGQRQRLCIARALAADPEILILDEAVAALDPLVQKQVLDLLKSIQENTGIIYIFITHNADVAKSFAHRVMRMSEGKLLEER